MAAAERAPTPEQVQIQLLRAATVAHRASLARSLSCTTMELARHAIREANPTAHEDERAVRFVAVTCGWALRGSVAIWKHDGRGPSRPLFRRM
ncbi:MAG: hypothetical protein QOF51_289 [Chloroflexota bacterium]|jgi:hypothetical protein|nr:hypothetical protein [Chloroflexota bacterium]